MADPFNIGIDLDAPPPETTLPPVGEKKDGKRAPRKERPIPKTSIPKKVPTTAEIGTVLGEILSMPAIAFSLPQLPNLKCDYCRDHFLKQGPETGRDLAKLSEDYPVFRLALQRVTLAWGGLSILGAVGSYVGAPLVHHGPVALEPLGPIVGTPPRNLKVNSPLKGKGNNHAHSAASAGTAPPTPDPSPFA